MSSVRMNPSRIQTANNELLELLQQQRKLLQERRWTAAQRIISKFKPFGVLLMEGEKMVEDAKRATGDRSKKRAALNFLQWTCDELAGQVELLVLGCAATSISGLRKISPPLFAQTLRQWWPIFAQNTEDIEILNTAVLRLREQSLLPKHPGAYRIGQGLHVEQPTVLERRHNARRETVLDQIPMELRRTLVAYRSTAFEQCQVACLRDCPKEQQKVWDDVGQLPRIVQTRDYLAGAELYGELDVFDLCLAQHINNVSISFDGASFDLATTREKKRALHKLAYCFRHPLPPDDCRLSATVQLPEENRVKMSGIDGELPPIYSGNTHAFWAPAGGFTDIHIDNGEKVITFPVGDTKRIIVCWPPTVDNLKAFCRTSGKRESLPLLCASLQGGVTVTLSEGEALLMPPATPHMVFTIQGGFQMARNFVDAETAVGMCMHLVYGMAPEEVGGSSGAGVLESLARCVQASELANTCRAWHLVSPLLSRLSSAREQLLRKETRQLLQQFQENLSTIAPNDRTEEDHQCSLDKVRNLLRTLDGRKRKRLVSAE